MSGEAPTRTIIQAEALAWLAENPAPPGTSVITSLPDVSEVPERGFEGWRAWFGEAARAVLRWVPEPGLVIFFQSDIRERGAWVDKGYLVQRAAEAEGRTLLWHKIVCRHAAGTISHGRASYSHLLCFAHAPHERIRHPGPDVLPDAGFKPWSKAMGVDACRLACRFLKQESQTTLVVDPFCGHGTALAVANQYGFDALGVELSTRKVRAAKRLELPADDG
ncbi:MAG: SAM-dependent methyltransferase [Myxococcales bacterium]